MTVKVGVLVLDSEDVGLEGISVELATYDGEYVDTGQVTDDGGKLTFELPYDSQETVRARIYVNGESRGMFELEDNHAVEFR